MAVTYMIPGRTPASKAPSRKRKPTRAPYEWTNPMHILMMPHMNISPDKYNEGRTLLINMFEGTSRRM